MIVSYAFGTYASQTTAGTLLLAAQRAIRYTARQQRGLEQLEFIRSSMQGGYVRYYWGLDVCRAIAVLLVFSVHYLSLMHPSSVPTGFEKLVLQMGHSGVDLFFVLSGYLLYAAFLKKPEQSRRTYLQHRAWRIFPAYWVALSAYALAMFVVSGQPTSSSLPWGIDAITNLLLLSPLLGDTPWMVVSWTLTFEWGWYLLLPLLFSLRFHQLNKTSRAILLGSGWLFFGTYFGATGGPEQISLFFAGALLAEYNQDIEKLCRHSRALWCALLLSTAIVTYNEALWFSIILSGMGWALCLSLALSNSDTPQKRWAPAIFLGKISYSFYLWHSLALHGTLLLLGNGAPWWLTLPAGLALSTVIAAVSYRCVEQPALTIVKKQKQKGFK